MLDLHDPADTIDRSLPGVADALATITAAQALSPDAAHDALTAAAADCPVTRVRGGAVARTMLSRARDRAYLLTSTGIARQLERADYLEREARTIETSITRQFPAMAARDARYEAALIRERITPALMQVAA